MRNRLHRRLRERGVVAPTTALALVVLVGFLGVVVDMGRLLVIKTELQNAADACSLAAAQELDGNAGALTRAENAGITAGTRNRVHFPNSPVPCIPVSHLHGRRLTPPVSRASSWDDRR